MKTALSLMVLGVLGGTASADPAPVKPRALPTGAPACGNVMSKSYRPQDPLCPVFRNLRDLEALGRKLDAELKKLDVRTAALTVPAKARPGS